MRKSLLLICLLLTPSIVMGSYFLEAGVDEVTALGQFEIQLTEETISLYGIEKVESPLLIDIGAKMGRSRPHPEGGRQDKIVGTRACAEGFVDACHQFLPLRIRDQNFTLVPPHFAERVDGTEEIHTQLVSFHLIDTCGSQNAIRMGYAAPEVEPSLGEVESLDLAHSHFPAQAFFNLFMEIDVDGDNDGIIDMTVFNQAALVMQDNNLTIFPPLSFELNSDVPVAVFNKSAPDAAPVGWLTLKTGEESSNACYEGEHNATRTVPEFEIRAFTAEEREGEVILAWSVTFEDSLAGYHLWRAQKNEASVFVNITRVTDELIPAGAMHYRYLDQVVFGTIYYYALETVYGDETQVIYMEKIISTAF